MLRKIYAGIGARKTPDDVLELMENAGGGLASLGFTLRSGGATGADSAFERGCDLNQGKKDIFLPWKGFNRHPSELYGTTLDARLMAKEFHPNWKVLSCRGRDFMGRNCYQILGKELNCPADFVMCWTPNGKVTGGTGQALRMATHFNIPVFNLAVMTPVEIQLQIERLMLT